MRGNGVRSIRWTTDTTRYLMEGKKADYLLTIKGTRAARDRLTTLENVLPSSQRPLPLPQAVDVKILRQRYRHLEELLQDTVLQLDRLLFTLPGAYLSA